LKPLPAAWQVLACASAAWISAGVAFAGIEGAQTACGLGVVDVSGPPPKLTPWNWERRVRAYAAVAFSCGRYWLRA